MNLDAYFARIGWAGPRDTSDATLRGVLEHHMRAIPFENLDVLLGRPPKLAEAALEAKLVTARRGGYCYEHSTLFAAMLRELGFTVRLHSARVIMVRPREVAPRSHMFLGVGDAILDPGFGGQAPLVPVPLDGTPAALHRLSHAGADRVLEIRDGDAWKPLWASTLEPDVPIDFEMANHFTATFPTSHFVNHLMARALTPDGEVRISNRDVTILRGSDTRTFQLADRRELRALLAEYFGFDLPEVETLRVPSLSEWA